MIRKQVQIHFKEGIVERPVAMCVQVASQFKSRITVEKSNMKINAKSIMGMMTLGSLEGTEVELCADGPDEADAVEKLAAFLTAGV